mgnify:CR=1 FL=1
MNTDQDERMAGDYAIIHALQIGDREIVLGENPAGLAAERFMYAFCQSNGLLASYTEVTVSDDYTELVRLYGERVAEQAEKTRIDLNGPKIQGIPNTPVTAEGCEVIGGQYDLLNRKRNPKTGRAADMGQRINAGYTITDSIYIEDTEFVLGVSVHEPAMFVTWACTGGDNYFWGHYHSDLLTAKKDLLGRASQELELQMGWRERIAERASREPDRERDSR